MENLGMEILVWFLGLVGTVLTGVLIPVLVNWLNSKTNNEKLQYVITELSQTVQTSINYVNQTFVEQLKADGKFDAEKQKEALEKAVTYCLDTLSDKAKKILGKDGIDLQSVIVKYIEAQISESKK